MLYTQTVAPETLELLKRLESSRCGLFQSGPPERHSPLFGPIGSVSTSMFHPPESFDEKSSWSFPYGTNMASKPNLQRNIL